MLLKNDYRMPHGNQFNMSSGNSYLFLFNKALENLNQVCEEYKDQQFCKKMRIKKIELTSKPSNTK